MSSADTETFRAMRRGESASRAVQSHERIGKRRDGFTSCDEARRLMIRNRGRARPDAPQACPTTLQEAKPKAGSFAWPTSATRTDRRRESKPRSRTPCLSPADRFCRSHDFQQAVGHPDENQSGRTRGEKRHVGPDRQKCREKLKDPRRIRICLAASSKTRRRKTSTRLRE
jgi:hypothetical protein